VTDVPNTTAEDQSPFGIAWRAFVAENPKIETLPAAQRAMLRRGFVYGWRAKEVAECLT
jgi:hypothetical protein